MDHSGAEQKQVERWRKIAQGEGVAMMRPSLQRRLERLEEAVLPVKDEPMRIEVYYCSPDGTEELNKVIELPPPRPWNRMPGRRRNR